MKRLVNVDNFKNVLPYASEIFGVYQPAFGLGVEARQGSLRDWPIHRRDQNHRSAKLKGQFRGRYKMGDANADGVTAIEHVGIGRLRPTTKQFKSTVLRVIASQLPPLEKYDDSVWAAVLKSENLEKILNSAVAEDIASRLQHSSDERLLTATRTGNRIRQFVEARINEESEVAATLDYLRSKAMFLHLKELFYKPNDALIDLGNILQLSDPLETFHPKHQIDRVALSPVGIVHLFRQYFFEFDTFLPRT